MKKLISIFLVLCLACTIVLSACKNVNDDISIPADADTEATSESESTEDEVTIFLPPFPEQTRAILHMIKPVESLDGWQAGKTEPAASLYVDDMTKLLDELDYKQSSDEVLISGDYDFRINVRRLASELEAYKAFINDPESDIFPAEGEEDKLISVQYLINYTEKTVNMRFIDYSAHVFDVYAELNENQMRLLTLCLKYYFGN